MWLDAVNTCSNTCHCGVFISASYYGFDLDVRQTVATTRFDYLQMKDPYLDVAALITAVQAVQATLSTRKDILKKTFDVWEDRQESPPAPKTSQVCIILYITQGSVIRVALYS